MATFLRLTVLRSSAISCRRAWSSSVSTGTTGSAADSTSITESSSSAWCAVRARPDSEMMSGIGSSSSRQVSASV
jgi:hypothetical protein